MLRSLVMSCGELWRVVVVVVSCDDETFYQRLLSSFSLYGVCWCLIMLNVFSQDSQSTCSSFEQECTHQLEKSKNLLTFLMTCETVGFPYE